MADSTVTISDLGHWNTLEEGEASKEDGGHRSRTAAGSPTVEPQRHQPNIFFPTWDIILIVSSAFSLFIDPLICYIPFMGNVKNDDPCFFIVKNDEICFSWDLSLMWTILVLRSIGDLFYYMDIIVFLKRFRTELSAKSSVGDSSTKTNDDRLVTTLRNIIHKKPVRFLAILGRIWVALPFSQALLLVGWYTHLDNSTLVSLIPFQYILRAYNHYKWLDRRANVETVPRRFLKAILDFLPFIIASHLYGSLWYFFALVRELLCVDHIPECQYGIYLSAHNSNMLKSGNLPLKILHCFWWGLQNLSSFASNLKTKFDVEETIFSIVISISGLVLFLVYLNSRVQWFRKAAEQRILRKKKEKTYPILIEQTLIVPHLCMDSLKKVPIIGSIDKKGLKAISEHLKPVIYNEDVYIIREGEPLRKMLFIWQGTTLTYTTSKGATNVCKCLEKNDFYGEELVIWALKSASFSELPICTTTLVSQSKVEAFSITANDLKFVVAKFWLHFRRDLSHSQVECFAASSIQVAWRRHHAKKLRDQLAGTSGEFCNFFRTSSLAPPLRKKAKRSTGWDKCVF